MTTPVHPGEILREDVLAELGITLSEATSRLAISRTTLSKVLHGKSRVSPYLAVRLEEAGVRDGARLAGDAGRARPGRRTYN